jgi:hypothetical protein
MKGPGCGSGSTTLLKAAIKIINWHYLWISCCYCLTGIPLAYLQHPGAQHSKYGIVGICQQRRYGTSTGPVPNFETN